MARQPKETDVPAFALKNEAARQRWELFHRAIAHAKQSNVDAMDDSEVVSGDNQGSGPLLSIVR